jgi:hypothetical protein
VADVLAAAGWGLLAGSALLVGAAVGWLADLSEWLVATIMAFGAGVLISAVSFELIDEAWQTGGLTATAAGAFVGAIAFAGADWLLTRAGMRQPKRMEAAAGGGSGTTIAVGALLDGLPESFVIGVSMLGGTRVSLATVVAIFVSNLPEGLSSSVAMRRAGRRGDVRVRHLGGHRAGWRGRGRAGAGRGRAGPAGGAGRDHRAGRRRGPGHGGRHHDPRGLRDRPGRHRPGHRARLPGRVRPVQRA